MTVYMTKNSVGYWRTSCAKPSMEVILQAAEYIELWAEEDETQTVFFPEQGETTLVAVDANGVHSTTVTIINTFCGEQYAEFPVEVVIRAALGLEPGEGFEITAKS